MKIYLVGGAVRDEILGKKPHDKDYLVVGATVEEMYKRFGNCRKVGSAFPVFLVDGCEYAMARKEAKTGDKHTDFSFEFGPDITLEEDVQRRDFTINALVKDIDTGEIIDLVGGKKDLEDGIIRHVNDEHFGEDPLRVLRMCRFAAQLNFNIAPETMRLAIRMVNNRMIDHLAPERIWKEIEKALETEHFEKFIFAMRGCGALKVILPEVDKLFSVGENIEYHPEGNSGAHTILVLKQGRNLAPTVKFALLMHDVGKSETPDDILQPESKKFHHYGHEKRGLPIIRSICQRLKVPHEYRDLALLGCEYHMKFHSMLDMGNAKAFDLIADVSRRFTDEKRLNDFMELCRCDTFGRLDGISEERENQFNAAVEKARMIFDKASKIHAQDMPDFDELQKKYITGKNEDNKQFALAYRQYLLGQVFPGR